MKSERLYYHNSYLKEFETQVLSETELSGQPAVILESSAFYPTSGGQPHDLGTLNNQPVLDVVAENGHVIHVLEQPLAASTVHGAIDWTRRFDHMVHHSGQHILTRAFIETCGAETVSFHLSEQSVTIDLETEALNENQIAAAEDLANQIIAENRTVKVWFPTEDELVVINLRKISEKVTGAVRVVDIGGFDVTACGGTHVAHTGEIGMIKVVRTDKKNNNLRIEFLCGQRALADYRLKNELLLNLSATLTTGIPDIPNIFTKMRDENKTLSRQLKTTKQRLISYDVEHWWNEAAQTQPVIVKQVIEDADKSDLQQIASQLTQKEATVALLGLSGESAHFVFARSEDLDFDVVPVLKAALATLDSQRGGGRPNMAQGGGVPADSRQVEHALNIAYEHLQESV